MSTKQINGVIYSKATICKTTEHAEKIAARHINNGTDAQVVKQGVSYAVYVSTGNPAPRKQRTSNTETHTMGVSIAVDRLNGENIPASVTDISGVDLTLDDGHTILVRAMSGDGRVMLINGALDTLVADFLVIATNVYSESRRKLYIMGMGEAKAISEVAYCNRDGHDEHFINEYEYAEYRNDYSTLA